MAKQRIANRSFRFAALLLCCCAAFPAAGCLDRTVTVTSTPPGAIVALNDTEVGRTPVETAFTFYGDYDIRLRLEGYEPVVAHKNFNPPVYEWIPIDLIATALPFNITTREKVHFDLQPAQPLDEQGEAALLQRARELRDRPR
jgi:hypothetical protein